jgi:uncharacterized RDD family membrane protein YckC
VYSRSLAPPRAGTTLLREADLAIPAPLHRRLAAGVIDTLPLWGVWAWAARNGVNPNDFQQQLIVLGAALGYIVYATVAELLAGRTIGKAIFGLRVQTITGGKPTFWAIVLRNVLRIVDLYIVPLATVLFTPLKQRLGDFVARTTVVADDAAEGDLLRLADDAGQSAKNAQNPPPPADSSRDA